MSQRDYVNLCVGHKDKLKREELFQREINYNIISGWAEKPPRKEIWWPIGDEPRRTIKLPSKAKLKHYDAIFRSLGKKKDG